MLLGDVLGRLRDESFAAETLVGLDDLPLIAGVAAEPGRHGETAGDYAASAVCRFAAFADDEDWLARMAPIERGPDPRRGGPATHAGLVPAPRLRLSPSP